MSVATGSIAQEYKPVKLFSLLHMSREKVEILLGEPQKAVFDHFNKNKNVKIASFQYVTEKGEYRIFYENELSKAIAFYPNLTIEQKFGEDKLFNGGIFDVDNFDPFFSECSGIQGQASLEDETYYMMTYSCSNDIARSIIFFGKLNDNVYRVIAYYEQ